MAGVMPQSGLKRFGGVPSAAGTLSRHAYARARAAGIDVGPLMTKAGLTREQVEDDSVRLTVESQIEFIELVAKALHDDFLGFHVAESFDLREMGLLYYVPASSETLGDALRRLERYSIIGNEGVVLRISEGDDLVVTFRYVGIQRLLDRHQIESFLTFLVRLCRQLTNRRLLPIRVKLCHRRKRGCPELNRFLGCDVVFGAETDEVAFPGATKAMPVVDADPYLSQLLTKYAEEVHSNREVAKDTFRGVVERTIAELMPHGNARAVEIARRLGMSTRTLMRRLAAEGLTLGEILSELRADLARRYLKDEELAISQIAWLLGYQEVSAFTHAFKRWTGKTPREVRAQNEAAR
jgi:AraC-like DNA-binding protein